MLVLISDLHLTDGSCGSSLSGRACELLLERIEELAVRASWRASGVYQPLERIDVVLLGDTLDLLQSTQWLQTRVRPWSNLHSAEGAAFLRALVTDILRHNEAALAVLRGNATEGGIPLVPADRYGRPAAGAAPQIVPLKIHYVVGEHDWPLHLVGPAFDVLRQSVAMSLGLASGGDGPFASEPADDQRLAEILGRHRAVARHGDQFDQLSFSGSRDQPSLADVLLIELVLPFVEQVRREFSADLPPAVHQGLSELGQVRPLPLMSVWLDALLDRACPSAALRSKIQRHWDRAADRMLALDVVRSGNLCERHGVAAGLAGLLKFNRRPTGNWATAVREWCQANEVCGGSLAMQALAEHDFRNRRAKYVVYGHTHQADMAALENSAAGGFALPQLYFNTGTWQRVHRPTQLAPGPQEFIASESFNLVTVYQGDERGGRGYETWSANLGLSPVQTLRRVDTPAAAAAQSQPPATGLHHGPHFTPAVWTTNVSSSSL